MQLLYVGAATGVMQIRNCINEARKSGENNINNICSQK